MANFEGYNASLTQPNRGPHTASARTALEGAHSWCQRGRIAESQAGYTRRTRELQCHWRIQPFHPPDIRRAQSVYIYSRSSILLARPSLHRTLHRASPLQFFTTMAAPSSTIDKSKPYFPLAGSANDGWSKEGEATATCFCGAVQLAFVSLPMISAMYIHLAYAPLPPLRLLPRSPISSTLIPPRNP